MFKNSILLKQIMLFVAFILFYGCQNETVIENKNIRIEFDASMHSKVISNVNGEEFIKGEQDIHPIIEIYLEERRVHGNAGCSTINGKVIVNENKIAFSEIITTEMACPGEFEQRFLTALQNVDNYKIEKLRLYLYEGEEERLVLRKID